jgi:glycosyltransferase involved in cell wall biosynthesis
MRIALYHNLPPGGALRFMNEIVRRSAEAHSYTTFSPATVPGTAPWHPATDAAGVARAERRLAAEINDGAFDIAFVHGCRVMQSPGVLTRLDIPSVYMCQEPRRRTFERGYRPGAKVRNGIEGAAWAVGRSVYDGVLGRRDRRAARAATALACNSVFSAEAIARAYGRDATVVHSGVDHEMFRPRDDNHSARSYYLSVGAIDTTKRHDLAVEAIGMLPAAARLPLVVVGSRSSADTAATLDAQAAALGVDLVLRHDVDEAELVELYRDAATTFCLSRLEPFGLTVLESTACGTPVVAVREGGFRETVTEGANGVLVEPSPADVAAGIGRVAELGLAADAARVSSVASTWTWEAAAKTIHGVFDELLAAR